MTVIARIAILLGGLLCARDVHGQQFCSEGSLSPHTGFCYHVLAEKQSKIEDARLICRNDYGGDIPSIFTGDENTFIHDLLSNEGSHNKYWIGVNDLYQEDSFRDVMLNEELTYDNWKSNEPDDGGFGYDCAAMQRDDGKWVDYTCTTIFSFLALGVICQQPPDPNPFTLCPANMLPYTTPLYTECYWFSMDKSKALDASLECAAMGSKLAFIEDSGLNDFIHSYQQSSELNTVWIGTQQIPDGSGQTYLSVEFGTTIPAYYDNFISEYSGSESPVCAAMIGTEDGEWKHLSCDDASHPYICRYNATVSSQNTTSAATTVRSTTTIATTTPTTTPSPTTTEVTINPTTNPTTTPSPNTTYFTILLPNTSTTTPSPTTPEAATALSITTPTTTLSTTTAEPTTSEATTTLPTSTPTTTHHPTTTEPTTSEVITTLPTTTPTTTHSPTTTEGTATLSTTTATPTTRPSTTESTTTLPTTTPTTNAIISQSTTTESTTSQSTTQEGSSSAGSITPLMTTSEATPTVRMSTDETGCLQVDNAVSRRYLLVLEVRYSNFPACLEVLKGLREPAGSPRRLVVENSHCKDAIFLMSPKWAPR